MRWNDIHLLLMYPTFAHDLSTWNCRNYVFKQSAVSLLASHQDDPGSIIGRVTPDIRMWESCRTMPLGFLGDLPFLTPLHSDAAPYSPQSPSSALRISISFAYRDRHGFRKFCVRCLPKNLTEQHKQAFGHLKTTFRPIISGVVLLHDNAHLPTLLTLQKLCFQVLRHPPYSPEIATSDFSVMFGPLRAVAQGRTRFMSGDDVKTAAQSWLNSDTIIIVTKAEEALFMENSALPFLLQEATFIAPLPTCQRRSRNHRQTPHPDTGRPRPDTGRPRPTQVEHAPTQVDHAPTQVDHTPTQVDHVPTQVDHAPTQVDHAPTQVDHAPTQVDHVPTQVKHFHYSRGRGGRAVSLLASYQGEPGSIPGRVTGLRMWKSCRTMTLIGRFSRGSSIFSTLSFRRCSIFTSATLIGSQDRTVKSRPNLFTHSITV
ncbi:hypothetical protein PR048_027781 [Dryococelus australis]|uniref:Uncharacterized protein n=1 Tax=Dryococelus australis TaxID=614101 RepID=A0ABQ9GHI5_9NEOP|nr:hypothetical protein PR048_027781 [Dryococelus australis]